MIKKILFLLLLTSCQPQTVPQKTESPSTTAATAEGKAPAPKSFDEQLQALIQPLIDDQWATGMLIGVVREKETKVYSFGRISADNPNAPDENTLFEIGSVTKVFTTTMLSEMVMQKLVSLDDPIQNYLPAEVVAAKRIEQAITLRELATHTAGLPAVADNFWSKEPGNIYDPNFAGLGWNNYTQDKLYEFIQKPSPGIFPFKRYTCTAA
jgi:D-alanyl-D-alanine-carboxypeptidase/D-alanyl-D-alanine-endopeptidase